MRFKNFLLNEYAGPNPYLGRKVSQILDAIQDLSDNSKGIGTRHLIKASENIVTQIRKILHTDWPQRDQNTLRSLQRVGVGIMKAIDDKSMDLESVLAGAAEELQGTLSNIGAPINRLGTPPEGTQQSKDQPQDQEALAEPVKPPKQQTPQPPQMGNQPQPTPPVLPQQVPQAAPSSPQVS
jgi:hypothetical protein